MCCARPDLAKFLQFTALMTGADSLPLKRHWQSRGAAVLWFSSLVALVGFTAVITYATAAEFSVMMRASLPTPAEVTTDVVVRDAPDAIGRRASFRILLFTDEFRWRLSSHDELDAVPDRPEFTQSMRTVLNSAEEVIVVGASSEELAPGVPRSVGREMEERRAARRADRIALWVREVLSRPVPVRKLNVGHHAPTQGARRADTSDQRRVVIILVLEQDNGVNLDQALRAAMAQESVRAPIFEALLTRYSLSAGQSFTWVP
jgi:hypothetical protein